jgi:hypothetical protein
MNKEITVYQPPKANAFGYSTVPRKLEKVWPSISSFLEKHSFFEGPESITLNAYHATDWDDEKIASSCISKVMQRFGKPQDEPSFYFQDGANNYKRDYVWNFDKSSFNEALEFLVQGSPWPKQVLGPVSLKFHISFFWKNFRTGMVLSEQEQNGNVQEGNLKSSFFIMLQRESFIQPEFSIPFSVTSKEFEDFLLNIYYDLPFRMNVKHLRKGLPSVNAKGYIHRKIENDILQKIEDKIKRIHS